MGRNYKKKLASVLAETKRLAAKKNLERGMHYCIKCGWGWEPDLEGKICPNCKTSVDEPAPPKPAEEEVSEPEPETTT